MQIVVNGETAETTAATLSELLSQLGYAGARIATAVNGDFVAERRRVDRQLAPGDRVEIVAPRQGG